MNIPFLRNLIGPLALAAWALFAPGCVSKPTPHESSGDVAEMQPAALAVLKSASDKLGAAGTILVKAQHKLDPGLGLGTRADRGPIDLAVKRPNQFYAIQSAGTETREIAYDGQVLCLMYPAAKHHALEPLEAKSIEQFAKLVDDRFGFRPPVAELLAGDMEAEMLIDVTSARLVGQERVGGTRCEHLRLTQEGMTIDLWVGTKDQLPYRMLTTVTDMPSHPTWDVRFSQWKLNEPLDESLFSKRPGADSQQVQMLKSR